MNETATNPDTTRKVTTLQALGGALPIGVPTGPGLSKVIEVKRWTMREEKAIGKLRADGEGQSVATYVAQILATMCPRLGPHNIEKMKFNEAVLAVSQLTMADVLYAWCYLRVSAMGPHLKAELNCPRCRNTFPWVGDIGSLEVVTVEKFGDALIVHELRDPIKVRDQEIKALQVGPMRWASIEHMSDGGFSIGTAKAAVIAASIYAVPGVQDVVLAEHELDGMSKFDLEALASVIAEKMPGPDMRIIDKCPRCKAEFRTAIDWGYDSFFSTSST